MKSDELRLIIEARESARSGRGARIRRAAGVSQVELADAIGVHGVSVSRWERGVRCPRGVAAIRYARLLRELSERL
jgi:DNA-binding transcriptional regulator YiaG